MVIAIALIGTALIVWWTADIFLLVFAAVLLAVFLRAITDFVLKHTNLSGRWALLTVLLGLGGAIALAMRTMAPNIAQQARVLGDELPKAFDQLRSYPWAGDVLPSFEQLAPIVQRAFSSTLGAGASLVIILAVGFYLSVDPAKYKRGVVALFPKPRRRRASEVLDEIANTLRMWLMGKIVGMSFVGLATTLGLWALGHPLAFTLGLMAGLLDFIPNVGPLIAFIPAVLLALMESPMQALYVIILYLAVQGLESYLIEPWMYQRNVDLPPALTVSGQVFFSILLGFLGLLVATPLLAVVVTLVKQLYLGDVLEDLPQRAA
ncbi:MAG TPA: AI-2E family transporter [Bryobacteraceae bacterium]|nr:AI-2E family transporter [Bryobacteraceae bacterium]